MRAKKKPLPGLKTRKLRHMEIINAYLKALGLTNFKCWASRYYHRGWHMLGFKMKKVGFIA